jgi:DNA-binding response OmpR family regulator
MQKKLLVVDDEQDFCKLVVLMLHQEPYQVKCAFSLREASEKLEKEHPAILLLDNNLPDGSGLDFLIRSRDQINDCQVILITADPSEQLRQKAMDAGVLFLQKPFGLKKIREMIKKVA